MVMIPCWMMNYKESTRRVVNSSRERTSSSQEEEEEKKEARARGGGDMAKANANTHARHKRDVRTTPTEERFYPSTKAVTQLLHAITPRNTK